nr:MAG: RNA-dependent RNA polymerase [Porcine picobirnavirus]
MLKDGTFDFGFYDCFNRSATKSLRSYFGRVEEGNDQDYRTPLFDGRPREEVLSEWSKILEPKLAGMEGLLDFENQLREKVGPLSIMKPLSERLDDIDAYYDAIHLRSKPISSEAISQLVKTMGSKISGLRLKNPFTTWESMKKSTSSGSPFFSKRSTVIDRTFPALVDARDMSQVCDRPYSMCAILGWRGQEGGPEDDDVKQRVIWMFPLSANIQELRLYQPLISGCQRFNLVPAWNGNDYVDEEVTLLFDTKKKDDVIICTDFDKFDHHFNADMQSCALAVLDGIFTHSSDFDAWKELVYPIKYAIPLAYKFGEIRQGRHGMASGSGGTNADETLSHKALQIEAAITSHAELNPHSMCLGDDGILTYPGIKLDHVLESYMSHGQEMNESKQSVSKTECTYLRRWHSSEYRVNGVCRGVYSTYRALGKLMGQERFYNPDEWGPEMVVMRSLSIIENCRWHPCKEEFLQFCVKGDKFRLGLDIPGFFENLEKRFESSELAQSFGSYTEGGVRGINSWWVVNALKAMR